MDGAFCDYSEAEKLEFLQEIARQNVINMEMESLAFAALTHHAGIRAAVICVTLLNRLNGDQVQQQVIDVYLPQLNCSCILDFGPNPIQPIPYLLVDFLAS